MKTTRTVYGRDLQAGMTLVSLSEARYWHITRIEFTPESRVRVHYLQRDRKGKTRSATLHLLRNDTFAVDTFTISEEQELADD